MLWVPAMAQGVPLEPMFESLVQFCRSQNAFAAVALAGRDQLFHEQTFCSVGQFQFLSDIIYLAAEVSPDEPNEPGEPGEPGETNEPGETSETDKTPDEPYRLQFLPLSEHSDSVSERLTGLVKATYHHSLDFPDLMQIAPVEHVLQGYKTGTLFRPELWFILRKEETDVGVLLLTDASPEQLELTYMGLLEPVRRQGLSREIVRFAKKITSREKRLLLLTSVDEKNVPACQTYLSHGFKAWDRKKVYARFFGEV